MVKGWDFSDSLSLLQLLSYALLQVDEQVESIFIRRPSYFILLSKSIFALADFLLILALPLFFFSPPSSSFVSKINKIVYFLCENQQNLWRTIRDILTLFRTTHRNPNVKRYSKKGIARLRPFVVTILQPHQIHFQYAAGSTRRLCDVIKRTSTSFHAANLLWLRDQVRRT